MAHICVGEPGHHWFRSWLVACSATSHNLNQRCHNANWNIENKFQWHLNQTSTIFVYENKFQNVLCKYGGHFFRPKYVDILRPRQNGRHIPDDCFKCIFLNENVWISIPLKFVPRCPINYIPALDQTMAWRRPGDKPLTESMVVILPTHRCVTRPQCVKPYTPRIRRMVHDLWYFVMFRRWSFCPSPLGLLCWNRTIVLMPKKWPWRINKSIMADNMTATKQVTRKLCAYFRVFMCTVLISVISMWYKRLQNIFTN